MKQIEPNDIDQHQKRHETNEFLTDQQLARMLDVTTRTTLRWRREGVGPCYVRAGLRRILYSRADVLAWTADRTFAHLSAEAVERKVTQ